MLEKLRKIIVGILSTILIIAIFVSGVILFDSFTNKDKIPSFFGWKPFIVLSGSMETKIMTGDIVIVKEVDTSNLKENDIIAFKAGEDSVITHRIIEIVTTEDGQVRYKTKGDNNNVEDSEYVYPNQVEGIYKTRIPKVGNFAMEIQKPKGMIIAIAIPLLFILLVQVLDGKNEKEIAKQKEEKTKQMEEELKRLREEKLK